MVQLNPFVAHPTAPRNPDAVRPRQQVARTPEGAAQFVSRQLESNPAFLKSITEKFRIHTAREAKAPASLSGVSSYRTAAGAGETSELGLSSSVRHQGRAEVAPTVRRARAGSLREVEPEVDVILADEEADG